MRRFVGWLLICCFLVWGPLEMLPLALAPRLPHTPVAVASAKPACACAICAARRADPKACCCTKAYTPAETLVMQAQCDDQHATALVVKAKLPLILPTLFASPVSPVYAFNHVFYYAPLLRVLTSEPSEPPPCHA